jgi:hypothetical protein
MEGIKMQNDENTPAPGSDLEDTEIGGDQGEGKSLRKKPSGVTTDQNPDHV